MVDGKKILGFLVLVGVVVGIKFYNRGDDSAKVLKDFKEIMEKTDGYIAHSDVLEPMIQRAHQFVFDEAYDMGGRRRGASFDEDKYVVGMLDYMLNDCRKRHKKEAAEWVLAVRKAVGGDEPAPESGG